MKAAKLMKRRWGSCRIRENPVLRGSPERPAAAGAVDRKGRGPVVLDVRAVPMRSAAVTLVDVRSCTTTPGRWTFPLSSLTRPVLWHGRATRDSDAGRPLR